MSFSKWILATFLVLFSAVVAKASPPDRALLLPYFETGGEFSTKSTLLSVTNPSSVPAEVNVTVYTNWAIPVLTVPFHLNGHATQSVNLRDWFVYGTLPADKRLCADGSVQCPQLTALKAQLAGTQSPADQLYYASTAGGALTGFAILQSTSPVHGSYIFVDMDQSKGEGQRLIPYHPQVDSDCSGICREQSIRFLENHQATATGLILWNWNGVEGQPSISPVAISQNAIRIAAFDDNGNTAGTMTMQIPASARVSISELKLGSDAGSLRITSDIPAVALVGYAAKGPKYAMHVLAESSCDPCPAPTVSASVTTGAVGVPLVSTIAAPTGTTISAANLPAGLALAGNIVSGTPTAAGTGTITVLTACGSTATADITVAACTAPTLTASSLSGIAGLPFTTTLTPSAGATIALQSTLPAGLTLVGNVISGTPLTTGSITVIAQNACAVSAPLTIVVNPNANPVVTASVTSGMAGLPFLSTITTTPGTTMTVTGLPAGLSLNGNVISGTPTASGTIHITVTAEGGATATTDIVIDPCALPTMTANVLSGTVGLPFASILTIPPGAALTVSGLPAGLSLVGNVISGTPSATGTIHAVVTAACGSTASIDIPINACPLPTISADLTSGTVGIPFLATLVPSLGATVTVDQLPAGLSLNGNIISGTPTAAGTATITVTSPCGAQATLSVTIAACTAPAILADTLMGTVGLPFVSTIAATPGATITAAGLPAGLTLVGNIISGTPGASGTATITATSACGATAATAITIQPCPVPTLSVTTASGVLGLPFISTITASPDAVVCVQGLPAGLTVTGGVISGTPTGTATIHIIATAPCGAVATFDIPIH
jgi:hypothetical protein